jgi:hypothetical protein
MATKSAEPDKLRITNQYRRRPFGKVCEIEYSGKTLSVHVWEHQPPEPGWRVEARSGSGDDAVVVGESAGTRAEALRLVAATWMAERRRPNFDWENITKLLASVRVV